MNRDTLDSAAVVDLARGARLTLPDTGNRYLSVMAVSDSHHLHRFYTDPGTHDLTSGELGSRHVFLAARFFVDANDPDDSAVVNELQDRLTLAEPDATVVIHLAPEPGGLRNHLDVVEGRNDAIRLDRPRPEVVDGTWTPPVPVPIDAPAS